MIIKEEIIVIIGRDVYMIESKSIKYLTRVLSISILSVGLILSGFTPLYAQDTDLIEDYSGESLREHIFKDKTPQENQSVDVKSLYDPEEEVEIIVELTGDSLLEIANKKADQSVQELAKTQRGKDLLNTIRNQQVTLKDQIKNLVGADNYTELYDYSYVLNGVSIKTAFKNLSSIQKLDGVKSAFVAATYDLVEPQLSTSSEMVSAQTAYDANYKGEGQKVGIVDTGLDDTHPAFSQDPSTISTTFNDIKAIVDGKDMSFKEMVPNADATSVYVSPKVPFAFDYADIDTDASPSAPEYVSEVDHGTHVASTAAGYALSEDGGIEYAGIAPQAQLFIFKVFPDDGSRGAGDAEILAALNDAVILDLDVINMSLGSSAGTTRETDEIKNEMYDRIAASGIVLDVSAGNSTNASVNNNYGGYNPYFDVDNGIVGSPSTYGSSLSVASIDNTYATSYNLLSQAGDKIGFTDTAVSIFTLLDSGDIEYVYAGLGTVSDFEDIDVEGKVALIQRGEIAFTEKNENAFDNKAIGTIIFNNVSGPLLSMQNDVSIPSVFISLEDGTLLKDAAVKTFSVSDESESKPNPTAGLASDFSSLGVTADLKLKPEIAAPGGSIWGALPTQNGAPYYGSMNGTSMAAPHVTGASALVKQYLEDNYSYTEEEKGAIVNALLMSTANPVEDADGVLTTPRKQGAGLINIGAAIETPVYLSVDPSLYEGNERPKLELGDDPEFTGSFDAEFILNNISNDAQTYNIVSNMLSPVMVSGVFISDDSVNIAHTLNGPTSITVGPNSTTKVQLTLTVDDVSVVENRGFGMYVDGFITLESTSGAPNLSIPYLGFVGDWTKSSVMDHYTWLDRYDEDALAPTIDETYAYVKIANGSYYFGANPMDDAQDSASEEMLAISPNGDGYVDGIQDVIVTQLRNSAYTNYSIKDSDGKVVYEYNIDKASKTFFNTSYSQMVSTDMYHPSRTWMGTDLEGKEVPEGRYTYTVSTPLDAGSMETNNDGDTLEFPVLVDKTAPSIDKSSVRFVERNGRYYMSLTVEDNFYVMGNYVYAIEDGSVNYYEPIYSYVKSSGLESTHTVEVDVTDLLGQQILVATLDSAFNEGDEIVNIPSELSDITFSESSVVLAVGESYQIVPILNKDGVIDWSSTNESIASVDANGVVSALSKGSTTILARVGEGIAKAFTVIVNEDRIIQDIELSIPDSITLGLGETAFVEALAILPHTLVDTVYRVNWESSDDNGLMVVGLPSFGTTGYQAYFEAGAIGNYTVAVSVDDFVKNINVEVVANDLLPSTDYFKYLTLTVGEVYSFRIDDSVDASTLIWNIEGSGYEGSVTSDNNAFDFTGLEEGYFKLSVTDGTQSREWNIHVSYPYVDSIAVEDTTIVVGDSITPNVDVTSQYGDPETAAKGLIWTLYNEDIVSLEDNTITANKVGDASLLVSSVTGVYDIGAIKVIEANKSQLKALIDTFNAISSTDVDESNYAELLAQVKTATDVLKDINSSQALVDSTADNLKEALDTIAYNIRGLEDSYSVKLNEILSLNPNPSGGTWEYDATFFEVVTSTRAFSDSSLVQLRAIKAGTTTITYTTQAGKSKSVSVEIAKETTPDKGNGNNNGGTGSNTGSTGNQGNSTDNGSQTGTSANGLPGTGQSSDYTLVYLGLGLIVMGSGYLIIRRRKQQN